MHIKAVAFYIIMGVYTLFKTTVLPKVLRKFQAPSSSFERLGYKSTRDMSAELSSHCHAEPRDIKPD